MASLPGQEQAGLEFAKAIGGQVVAIYRVEGHSREYIFYSDAAEAMLSYRQLAEDVGARRFDYLWAYDEDRLGRHVALIAQVIALVERSGAEVFIQTSPHPLGQKTASSMYLSMIKGVRATEEMERLRYKFSFGMKNRVLKRGLASGIWPMGYRAVRDQSGKTVGAEESELAGAVREATRLFLMGLSYPAICRRMDESPFRPPRAERWKTSTLREMMLNDCYAGSPVWKGAHPDGPSGHFPPLWDDETFQAITRERRRRAHGPYNRTGGGFFSGVAFCGACGWAMYRWGHHRNNRLKYLNCGMYGVVDRSRCKSNHIAERRVVDAVAEALEELTDPGKLDATLAAGGDGRQEETLRQEMDRARRSLAELERRRVRLGHGYAAGDMAPGVYRQVDAELGQQLEAERQRIADLERAVASLPDLAERRAALELLARDFRRLVEEREPAEISTLLQQASVRVTILAGEVMEVRLG